VKPETQQRARLSAAAILRAVLASSWFWQHPLLPRDLVRKNRARLQRAARRAKDDPLGFVEKYLGLPKSPTDSKFPERAAVALSEILDPVAAVAETADGLREFLASEENQRKNVRSLAAFMCALAARPGRPRTDKYRRALLHFSQGKSILQLCQMFEPGFTSMKGPERRKALERMRKGVTRVTTKVVTQTVTPLLDRTKPPL